MQIFIIDNSAHMQKQELRDCVIRWFKVVSYLVKGADKDGIEVLLTSERIIRQSRRTSKLVDYVYRNFSKGAQSKCNMENILDTIVDRVISRFPDTRQSTSCFGFRSGKGAPKPVSIYVLTNGVWDVHENTENLALNADLPLLRLVKGIREHELRRTHAIVQFVRFGGNQDGIQRLKYLDDRILKPAECVPSLKHIDFSFTRAFHHCILPE